ncbi:MAG TPA: tRNA pseudouridine(55) synthase TruB [Candidatus Polarisedimenticolaceae bacterium]|nr:tRNA pseudouridine(55) synthase TruB [Candidatus Polarisedimenticolaceae bacterium]
MSAAWDGLLLVDKPSGPTSHDVVDRIRELTGQRRIGHAGTLDPLATGLLPLVLGRATRLVRFMPHSPKFYQGLLRLGVVTRSDDCTGEIVARHEGPLPEADEVVRAAAVRLGRQLQSPPAVSARKVGGERMYRLARRGVVALAEPRLVEVTRFDVAPCVGSTREFRFEAEVSAGTYLRSLVRDLGASLGCGATLVSLRRTAIGSMRPSIELRFDSDPPPVGELRRALIPVERIPLVPPPVRLSSSEDADRFRSGVALAGERGDPWPEGCCRVLGPSGELLGVAEVAAGRLHPRVVLAATRGAGLPGG